MLRRLLTPPDLADPEERRQATAILGILVPAAVVMAVLAATTPLLSEIIFPTLPLRLGLLALMVGGVWLAHQGRPRLVIGIVIPGMWIVVTVMTAVTGGNRSPAVVGYFLILMAAGYLWGRRGALFMGALALGTVLVFALFERAGLLPDFALPVSTGRVWAAVTVGVLMTGIITEFGLKTLTDAVEESQESERKFAAFLQGIPDGIAVVDRDGTIVEVNRGLEVMFDIPRERLIGRPVYILVPGGFWGGPTVEAAGSLGDLEAALEVALEATPWESVGLRSDGSEFPIQISLNPVATDAGTLVIGSIRDVSEQHRLQEERQEIEDQLRQSQKMESIGQLAGGIAHDFNNLLTVIMGNTSIDLAERGVAGEVLTRMRETNQAAESAAELTSQLLAFSRKQIMAPRRLDLTEVVHETSGMLRRVIGEDITLEVIGEEHAWVEADPNQIKQVLLNLAANARDAMPRGGDLSIMTRIIECGEDAFDCPPDGPPGTYVLLSVSDTGMGMDQETMDRVFEPFFTTKERGRGTGLGLAMVHGIIRQSGGYVLARALVDSGSTLEVYLPLMVFSDPEASQPRGQVGPE